MQNLSAMDGARFLRKSFDSKLSRIERVPHGRGKSFRSYALVQNGPCVAATYVSIRRTCPSSCPFKGAGCYASAGYTRVLGKRLDEQASSSTPLDVIRAEVKLIDGAWADGYDVPNRRPLRLHVGGETPSIAAARLLAGAADRWKARGGGPVWTYTHNWREIPRFAFGSVSTLASVESVGEAEQALRNGYVPAITVPWFPGGAKAFKLGRIKVIPCPAEIQPGKMNCANCRLCLDDSKLRAKGMAIAFSVHGTQAGRAVAAITQTAEAA